MKLKTRERYDVIFAKPFLKDLKNIERSGNKFLRDRLIALAEELKDDPKQNRPKVDIKMISSRKEGIYRARLGKYRLIYEIDDTEKTVYLTALFHREQGYRGVKEPDEEEYS